MSLSKRIMASSETFKPGLFGIGLNIEKKVSKHYLLISSKQLSYHVKLKPKEIKPAIHNLQAVLLFHMDSGRTKARLKLEELVTEYPQDLNILADLIHVYKQMGCDKDSDSYKKKLNDLKQNKLLQARSILAQANAINYELTAEYYRTPKLLLEDIYLQLNTEDKHLKQVDKAIDMVEDAYEMVKKIPVKVHEKTINSKEISIEKFEKGIKMLQELDCSEEEILIWKHNLANARGKLDTFRKQSDENCESRIEHRESRFENCIKVLEAHADVIENLSRTEEPLKLYVARSYIFFAQFYMSHKNWFDKIELPERIKSLSKDLDSMQQKALSICPDDLTVLQRCGRYKLNQGKSLRAIRFFNSSIELEPDKDINWFSYTSRSNAFYYMSQLKNGSDEGQNNYLELAYSDKTLCMNSKCTVQDMITMAGLCLQMAKPYYGNYFRCQNVEYIYEALEIIHETFKKRDITEHSKIHFLLGKGYTYIHEYRKAIESLKTVLELNKWSRDCPNVFSLLCKCFSVFYKEYSNENLLPEFRYMLKEAQGKQCNRWVTNAIYSLCRYNPKMLADLIGNMIEWDVRGCNVLIGKALNIYTPVNEKRSQKLWRRYETKLQRRDCEKQSNITGPAEIQKSLTTKNFKYDFYVSHSEEDKDWVNCMLVPQLEDYDDEIKFRGFIPSRDFVPGQPKIDSMIKGIKQSRKLLIVLTPNYLTNKWLKYVRDQMIFSVFERKVREKTIIPIIMEHCEIPLLLQGFIPICFRGKSEWARLRSALTVNMDPERSHRKKMDAMTLGNVEM